MDTLITFLAQQPLLALFLVIASGYALGAVNMKGLSLGVGAVLFSGLLVGALVPKAQPPALVGTLGLVMFLYGLGVTFGRQFFEGLAGKAGRRYLLLAVALALRAAFAVTVVERRVMGVSHPMMVGLFAGAGTSAATMQAAMEAAGSSEPAIGYSVAFPFGLVGAILCMYALQLLVKPKLEAPQSGAQVLEVAVRSSDVVGQTIADVAPRLPRVRILVVRAASENRHPARTWCSASRRRPAARRRRQGRPGVGPRTPRGTRERPGRRRPQPHGRAAGLRLEGRNWRARVSPTSSCRPAWWPRSRTCSAATPTS